MHISKSCAWGATKCEEGPRHKVLNLQIFRQTPTFLISDLISLVNCEEVTLEWFPKFSTIFCSAGSLAPGGMQGLRVGQIRHEHLKTATNIVSSPLKTTIKSFHIQIHSNHLITHVQWTSRAGWIFHFNVNNLMQDLKHYLSLYRVFGHYTTTWQKNSLHSIMVRATDYGM